MTAILTYTIFVALIFGVPGLIGYAVLGGVMRFLGRRSWKGATLFYMVQLGLVAGSAALLVRVVGQMLNDGSVDGPTGFAVGALGGIAMFSAVGLETGATISFVLILLRIRRVGLPKPSSGSPA